MTVPGSSPESVAQIHHHLHADGPVANVVALRHAEVRIELAPDRADRTVGDHRQAGVDVHAGHVALRGCAGTVHALVDEANAGDPITLDERF